MQAQDRKRPGKASARASTHDSDREHARNLQVSVPWRRPLVSKSERFVSRPPMD
jgi:hypothetical protein